MQEQGNKCRMCTGIRGHQLPGRSGAVHVCVLRAHTPQHCHMAETHRVIVSSPKDIYQFYKEEKSSTALCLEVFIYQY